MSQYNIDIKVLTLFLSFIFYIFFISNIDINLTSFQHQRPTGNNSCIDFKKIIKLTYK